MYEIFFPIKILVLLLIKAFEHGFKLCKKTECVELQRVDHDQNYNDFASSRML